MECIAKQNAAVSDKIVVLDQGNTVTATPDTTYSPVVIDSIGIEYKFTSVYITNAYFRGAVIDETIPPNVEVSETKTSTSSVG